MSQNSPLEFRPLPLGTTLTAAVLGPEENVGDVRSILLVKVGVSQPIAIASFVSNVCENAALNLAFEEGSNVVFTVRGPGVIHISGRHFFDGESTTSREPLQPDLSLLQDEEEEGEEPQQQEENSNENDDDGDDENDEPEAEAVEASPQQTLVSKDKDEENESSGEGGEEEPGKKRRRRAKGNESDMEVKTIRIKGENLQYIDLCKVWKRFLLSFF